MDPLTSVKYPDSMRSLVGARLPRFTNEESKELKGSFDFLGFNYYSTQFAINNPNPLNPLMTDYALDACANLSCKFNLYSVMANYSSIFDSSISVRIKIFLVLCVLGISDEVNGVYIGSVVSDLSFFFEVDYNLIGILMKHVIISWREF